MLEHELKYIPSPPRQGVRFLRGRLLLDLITRSSPGRDWQIDYAGVDLGRKEA